MIGTQQLWHILRKQSPHPDIDEASTDDCRIICIRVEKQSKDSGVNHAAIIQFRPMRTGDIELPALEFKSETESLTTAATQITVSERVKSDRMQLKFTVDNQSDLYVGQTVRIDLEWTSDLASLNTTILANKS